MPDKQLTPVEISLTGKLVTSIDGMLIGPNFQSVINFEYTDTNPRGIKGMTKVNSTALANPVIDNGYHYKTSQPQETHLLVHSYNALGTTSYVYESTDNVPDTSTFTLLHTDATAGVGRFSDTPTGMLAYCNGTETMLWGGDEYRIAGFINYDPGDTFKYVHTEKVQNTLADTQNTAVLYTIPVGIDSNVMLLLHLDNNVTDSSPTTPHTISNTNVTFSTGNKVFGTHAAEFNGSTAYLSTADDADFDFSGGSFCIDFRGRFTTLTGTRPLYHQAIEDVETIGYDNGGTYEPQVGDILQGNTSAETATIDYVVLSSGTWVGSNAVGTFYVTGASGPFNASEQLNVVGEGAVAGGNTTNVAAPDHYIDLSVVSTGAVRFLVYHSYLGQVVSVSSNTGEITTGAFYHIEINESGNNWYLFVDGIQKSYVSSSNRAKNYTGTVYIGYDGTNYHHGYIDEYRVSNVVRNITNFTPPLAAYSATSTAAFMYIGSIMPLDGFKFYMETANANTSAMSVDYWDGTSWTAVTGLSDGTAVGGISLAQDGVVSFTSTEDLAKVKVFDQAVLYWYRVSVDDISSGTSIYYATVRVPFQKTRDLWDGVFRTCLSFLIYKTSFNDYTQNITEEDYTTANDATYAQAGGLTSSQYIVCGFAERQLGLNLTIIGEKANTTAGTTLTVSYWNGSAWTAVTGLDDGTSENVISMSKSGLISWTSPDSSIEFKKEISKEEPLYYYKLSFDKTLSTNVYIDFVAGIPTQKDIKPYKIVARSQNRTWLLANQAEAKNSARCSSVHTSNVFNGEDSKDLFFGDDSELTGHASLYSQFGSSLYDVTVFTKTNEVWVLTGSGPSSWVQYTASTKRGCVAPLTMQTAHIGGEVPAGLNRNVAVWQSATSIDMFDGRVITELSRDIDNYFDQTNDEAINLDKIGDSKGFFNHDFTKYHWLFASGTSTTLNKELVYDFTRQKWSEIDRGTKKLQAGFNAQTFSGINYSYGGTSAGYVQRLENGQDFDGEPISYELWTTDQLLGGSFLRTQIRGFTLFVKSKLNSDKITVTHYSDSNTQGKSFDIDHYQTGLRVARIKKDRDYDGLLHSIKLTSTNNAEDIGFEPLHMAISFKTKEKT